MAVATSLLFAVSCGNTKASNNCVELEEGGILAEEVAETSLEEIVEPSDSINVISRSGSDSEGFGRCSKCACKKFEGRGDVCKNCGHAYKKHY